MWSGRHHPEERGLQFVLNQSKELVSNNVTSRNIELTWDVICGGKSRHRCP